jgi:hypothetical protein
METKTPSVNEKHVEYGKKKHLHNLEVEALEWLRTIEADLDTEQVFDSVGADSAERERILTKFRFHLVSLLAFLYLYAQPRSRCTPLTRRLSRSSIVVIRRSQAFTMASISMVCITKWHWLFSSCHMHSLRFPAMLLCLS